MADGRRAARDGRRTSCSTRLAEAKQELFNLRFQHVTGQLDNYARLRAVRKDIARMHTDPARARDRRGARQQESSNG